MPCGSSSAQRSFFLTSSISGWGATLTVFLTHCRTGRPALGSAEGTVVHTLRHTRSAIRKPWRLGARVDRTRAGGSRSAETEHIGTFEIVMFRMSSASAAAGVWIVSILWHSTAIGVSRTIGDRWGPLGTMDAMQSGLSTYSRRHRSNSAGIVWNGWAVALAWCKCVSPNQTKQNKSRIDVSCSSRLDFGRA